MADEIKKRIVIDGEVSGAKKSMEELSQAGENLYSTLEKGSQKFANANDIASKSGRTIYEAMQEDAKRYTQNIDEQIRYIDKLIAAEEKRLKLDKEIAKLDLEDERKRVTKDLRNPERVNEDYEERKVKSDEFYDSLRGDLLRAKKFNEEARDERKAVDEDDPVRQERLKNNALRESGPGVGNYIRQAGGMTVGFGKMLLGAMGVGIAFGIGGIVHSMIGNANELQRSQKDLEAVLKGVKSSSDGAASSLGKTQAQMNELIKEVAITTGGMYGADTGNKAMFIARMSRGYSLDEGALSQSFSIGRISLTQTDKDILMLLRELNRSGVITSENTALLNEKFQYWSQLNTMQQSQLLTVSPMRSIGALMSLQETKLPVLSDQRQMEYLQSMNQGIINPKNDFVQAFLFDALSKKGTLSLMATQQRMEQGIFGKENMKDIMEYFQEFFKGAGTEEKTRALHQIFGGSLQLNEKIVQEIINDPGKFKSYYSGFERFGVLEESIKNAKTDKEKDKYIKEYNEETKKWGGIVKEKAGASTPEADRIKSQITDIMANSGMPLMRSLSKVIGDKDVQDAIKTSMEALAYAGAELISAAAPIIKEAAVMFKDAVVWLVDRFNPNSEKEKQYQQGIKQYQELLKNPNVSNETKEKMRDIVEYTNRAWKKAYDEAPADKKDIVTNNIGYDIKEQMFSGTLIGKRREGLDALFRKAKEEIERGKKERNLEEASNEKNKILQDIKDERVKNALRSINMDLNNSGMIEDFEKKGFIQFSKKANSKEYLDRIKNFSEEDIRKELEESWKTELPYLLPKDNKTSKEQKSNKSVAVNDGSSERQDKNLVMNLNEALYTLATVVSRNTEETRKVRLSQEKRGTFVEGDRSYANA